MRPANGTAEFAGELAPAATVAEFAAAVEGAARPFAVVEDGRVLGLVDRAAVAAGAAGRRGPTVSAARGRRARRHAGPLAGRRLPLARAPSASRCAGRSLPRGLVPAWAMELPRGLAMAAGCASSAC